MAFSFQPKVVTDGMILYLDAANTKSYLGSGTVWRDLSQTAITGSLTNGPIFSSTNNGVITFDGADDCVRLSNNLGANPYNARFTFSVWFRSPGANGRKLMGIEGNIGFSTTAPYDRHIYLGTDGKIRYSAFDGSPKNLASAATNYGDNVWHNATVTTGNGVINLYTNGVYDIGISGSAFSGYTTSYLKIGGEFLGGYPGANAGSVYWSGSIAQVSVYNRPLSATEVLQNYNALKGRFGLT